LVRMTTTYAVDRLVGEAVGVLVDGRAAGLRGVDPFTRAVYVTIARLKRKLGNPPLIHTTPGIGYRSMTVT
jgi:Transcriptional regulatory protein, C terminal